MPKNHDEIVAKIIRYAGLKHVSLEAQKEIVEAALEYLAATRMMPEGNISNWPEKSMIGGFHSLIDEAIASEVG